MFSCKISQIFKSIFFTEHLRWLKKKKQKICYTLIKKIHIKGEKHITPMDFAEDLRKSDVSENSKVCYMVDFYEK